MKKRVTLSTNDKLNLISNLSTMISAGIPILTAIKSLSEDAHGNIKKILEQINTDLLQGKHLHASFEKFPHIFDAVTINMIKASEETGSLDVALSDLKEQIKRDIQFKRKIRAALTYPAVVMVIFFAVLLMILIVVIPKIATVFSQLKVKQPLPTKVLIYASNFVVHYTIFFLLGAVILIGGIVLLYIYQKKKFIRAISKLPLISRIVKNIELVRFTRSMYLLLNSGIPLTTALGLTEKVVETKDVVKAISHAKQSVLSGKTMSESFKLHKKVFSNTSIQLVQAGEKTGSLDKSMRDLSEYLDFKVIDDLQLVTTLIEPIVLVMVAILVGGMMLAIIGPIYNMIGQISNVR